MIAPLKQVEAGRKVEDMAREVGVRSTGVRPGPYIQGGRTGPTGIIGHVLLRISRRLVITRWKPSILFRRRAQLRPKGRYT